MFQKNDRYAKQANTLETPQPRAFHHARDRDSSPLLSRSLNNAPPTNIAGIPVDFQGFSEEQVTNLMAAMNHLLPMIDAALHYAKSPEMLQGTWLDGSKKTQRKVRKCFEKLQQRFLDGIIVRHDPKTPYAGYALRGVYPHLIYIGANAFGHSELFLARVILHEISHLVFDIGDLAYLWRNALQFTESYEMSKEEFSTDDAFQNADNYAVYAGFCYATQRRKEKGEESFLISQKSTLGLNENSHQREELHQHFRSNIALLPPTTREIVLEEIRELLSLARQRSPESEERMRSLLAELTFIPVESSVAYRSEGNNIEVAICAEDIDFRDRLQTKAPELLRTILSRRLDRLTSD